MKYKCCACGSIFNGREIQDDYKNGIHEGFLCPKCGANIKDDLFGGLTLKAQIINASLVFLFVGFLSLISKCIADYFGLNYWFVSGVLTVLYIAIYAFVKKIYIKEIKNNVSTTQRVNS